MRQLPCARHPLNHFLVQELALHAALADARQPPCGTQRSAASRHSNDYDVWAAAAQWARSPLSAHEAVTYYRGSPQYPSCGLAAESLVRHRLSHDAIGAAGVGVCGPSRLVPLYGPRTVLPPLPQHVHDPVTYGHAVAHQQLLARLLEPFGLQVALCGVTRRGCPVGHHMEVLLTLSAAAEAELVEAETAVTETGMGPDSSLASPLLRSHSSPVAAHDAAAPPHATPSWPSPSSADSFLPSEACSTVTAYAATDTFSGPVAYRLERAIQGLTHAAYLVAGRMPQHQDWERRTGKLFTVRLDACHPQRCPPHNVCDPASLAQLRLHRLVVHVSPRHCQVARQFLLTGPAAFTSHVTLEALARGYELNMNGLFTRATSGSSACRRVLLRSEADLFRVLQLPYVDPFNRGIYCQLNTA